jgi:cobalt/nickel transport system permease protein
MAAGVGAYLGINAAALAAAVEFGIQPDLFYKLSSSGAKIPLYAPFHLSQSIPTMLFAHLVVAGVVDGALTFGVVVYLQRANLPLLRINHHAVPETDADIPAPRTIGFRWAFVGLAGMAALVPLGLVATGTAFGEDAPDDLVLERYGLSAVPAGLARYSDFWSHSLFPGYDFERSGHPTFGYYASAAIGTVLIGLAVIGLFAVVRLLRRRSAAGDEVDAISAAPSTP